MSWRRSGDRRPAKHAGARYCRSMGGGDGGGTAGLPAAAPHGGRRSWPALSGRNGDVKAVLTSDKRHDNLDAVGGGSGAADPVVSRVRDTAARLADELARAGAGSPLAAMAAARELSAVTGEALQEAVDRARAARP